MKVLRSLFLALGVLLSASGSARAVCVLPYTLLNNTLADANQVMANFNAVVTCVGASTAGITRLTGDVTTPLGPGIVAATLADTPAARTNIGLGLANSPQFTGLTLSGAAVGASINNAGALARMGVGNYPCAYFSGVGPNTYLCMDRGDSLSDASIVARSQGHGRLEYGLLGDADPLKADDFHVKTVTGNYLSEVFTSRMQIRAHTTADNAHMIGTGDFFGPGPLRRYGNSGIVQFVLGSANGMEYPDAKGEGFQFRWDFNSALARMTAITHDAYYRDIVTECNNCRWSTGPVFLNVDAMLLNSQGALLLGDPIRLAGHADVSNAGEAGIAQMSLYDVGQVLTALGGTGEAPTFTVTTLQAASSTINAAGSGGANGACVLTGTTGTGTKYQRNSTIAGGAVTALGTFVTHGDYTVKPTTLSAEPMTGCGLVGHTQAVAMGALVATMTTPGAFTESPVTPTLTSSSGAGVGATLDIFYQNIVGSLNARALWIDGVKTFDGGGAFLGNAAPQIIAAGDSLVSGQANGPAVPYDRLVSLPSYKGREFVRRNIGIGGSGWVGWQAYAPTWLDPFFQVNSPVNIVTFLLGSNDLAVPTTPAATWALAQIAITNAKAEGFKVCLIAVPSRTGLDTDIGTYNGLAQAGWGAAGADCYIDIWASPIFNAGSYADLTYYSVDGIHLTAAGNVALAALVQTGLTAYIATLPTTPALVAFPQVRVGPTAETKFSLAHRPIVTDFPVATFRPSAANSVMTMDIMPNGSPAEEPGNGFAWYDTCDTDIFNNNNAVTCARAGARSDAVEFGSRSFNGAASKPIVFTVGAGVEQARIATNGDFSSIGSGAFGGAQSSAIWAPNKGVILVSDGTMGGNNGGLFIVGKTNSAKFMQIGFDTTSNYSYWISGVNGASWNPIALAPAGGTVLVGTATDGGSLLQVNGTFQVLQGSPAATDACQAGQMTIDTGFFYGCASTGVWKRAALTGGY